MHLTFDSAHVAQLIEASARAQKRRPCYVQIADPKYWRGDLPSERLKKLQEDISAYGLALSATGDDVDPDKIGPGLWLVGDQGVYLMSNAPIEEVKAAGISHVAYAYEADPGRLPVDQWAPVKHKTFGPDDGIDILSEEAVRAGLVAGAPYRIFLTPGSLVLPVVTGEHASTASLPESGSETPDP